MALRWIAGGAAGMLWQQAMGSAISLNGGRKRKLSMMPYWH
jgi:hypothetical protein